ncbi:MAG: UvrB/UvrC motif-containing protein [Spirochaetota bacterium]
MSTDISRLLEEWPYDDDNNIRVITADDGRSVLQVRQPLGIEQYELDGRPDGLRPDGYETVVEVVEHRLAEYQTTHGTDDGFELAEDASTDLENEGILYYYRYLLLFQLNDFERVIRDTRHNLRICDLLEKYAEQEDAEAVLQFKPYIYRMHSVSKAMDSVQRHQNEEARTILEEAIEVIESMKDVDTPAFEFERVRSVNYLRSALEQIDDTPDDPVDRLKKELAAAVQQENYERAAELRDHIRELS